MKTWKSLINEDYSFITYDNMGNEVICDTLVLIENDENENIRHKFATN